MANRIFWLVVLVATAFISVRSDAGAFYNSRADINANNVRSHMSAAYLVKVKPGQRAYFYDDALRDGCPKLSFACRKRAFVVGGDVLVATGTVGRFTSVYYVAPSGRLTSGAIETRLLNSVPTPTPTMANWHGEWRSGPEQQISIRPSQNRRIIYANGNATWGASDPERVARGGVNLGSFAAFMQPAGQWAGFSLSIESDMNGANMPATINQPGLDTDWSQDIPFQDDDSGECRALFRLLSPYLLVYDDGNHCGGHNVSFTGVYGHLGASG